MYFCVYNCTKMLKNILVKLKLHIIKLGMVVFMLNVFSSFSQSQDSLLINVDSISVDSAYKYQDVSYAQDLSAETQIFDSLHLSIRPPLYFMKLDSMVFGFVHLGANSSIMINEVEPIVLGIAPYYNEKSFTDIKQELVQKDTLFMNDGSWGYFFVVNFTEQNKDFQRIILITPSKSKAIVVMANYPIEIREMLHPIFIESLKTLKVER